MLSAERVSINLKDARYASWARGRGVLTEGDETRLVSSADIIAVEEGKRAVRGRKETYEDVVEACAWAVPFEDSFIDYLYSFMKDEP